MKILRLVYGSLYCFLHNVSSIQEHASLSKRRIKTVSNSAKLSVFASVPML